MLKILLVLHLLFAVFAIGPLVHAATTAARGVRHDDAAATAYSARMARIYANASVLVVIFGLGLMSAKRHGQSVATISETWIWLSILLWVIAVGLVHAAVAPSLDKATALIGKQESAKALTARVAVAGAAVGLVFAGIVFLMVYRPGGK
jgi:hypothetical protein